MTFDYLDSFVGYELGYTDSDQPRVAKYKAIINSIHQAGDYTLSFTYTGLFDREPGPYDGTAMLDDVSSLDYKIESEIAPNYLLSATIRDILDKTYEYLPGYNSGGVEILITLQYRP
jgi:outer membrane cobalamin receptor